MSEDEKITEAGLQAAGFVARWLIQGLPTTEEDREDLAKAYIQLAIEHDNLRRNQESQHRIAEPSSLSEGRR